MVCDSNCCVDRHPGIFDHRLGEICFALGHANRRTGCVPAIYSTFKSDAGTIPDSHSCAYTKGNTHSYPKPYAVTKSSAYASASPASTPPPIASFTFAFIAGFVVVPATEKQRSRQRDRDAGVQGGFQIFISLLALARRLTLWLVL
jgi:hypothetical protein